MILFPFFCSLFPCFAMPTLFSPTLFQLIFSCAGIAIFTAVAFYVLRVIRVHPIQRESETADHLDYFQELHSQGKLSDREFRIIKRQLSSQIVDAIKEEQLKASPLVFRPEVKDAVALLAGRQREEDRESGETGMFGKEETAKIDN